MYKLHLTIDGIPYEFQDASQMRMIREVTEHFVHHEDLEARIPFTGYLNGRGQIVEMTIDNNQGDIFWSSIFPPYNKNIKRLTGKVEKCDASKMADTMDVPDDLKNGEGMCWVAVKNMKIVALIHCNSSSNKGEPFYMHRDRSVAALKEKGSVLVGNVFGSKFIPRRTSGNEVNDAV